jgi:PRTRC genetic system protein F
MQLNANELFYLENAIPSLPLPTYFLVPTLHEAIPRMAEHISYQTDFATLGQELLTAGIINPDAIAEDTTTAKQVVEQGLRAWFMPRIGRLNHMRFDVRVVDAENANAAAKDGGWENLEFDGAAVSISGDIAEMRFVKDIALHVEQRVPELFLTAFTELTAASYKTVDIHHPERILEMEAAYSLWGNDIHSVTDAEAREELIERYGEEETPDYYMPDQMLEAFGNGYCMDITRKGPMKKRRRFPELKLKKLAKSEDAIVAGIASQLLNLRRARKRVDDLEASFSQARESNARPMYVGCILLFSGDDRETHFMDDEHQHLMETGDGTELYAIDQLPATAADLKTHFQKLDALFDLIAQMDALIPKLSYPYDAE